MRTFIAISLLGLVSAVHVVDFSHYVLETSFNTALLECAELYEVSSCELRQYKAESFPNKPVVRRLIRCALLNLKSWNDVTGVFHLQMSAFFQHSHTSSYHCNQTLVCLNSVSKRCAPADVNTLAYEAFLCYYRVYGSVVDSVKFVRNTHLELQQLFTATFEYLQFWHGTHVEFCHGNDSNHDQFAKFLYVFLVRGGFYSTKSGFRLDRLYTQFGNDALLSHETQQCVYKMTNHCGTSDKVSRNYQVFMKCLDGLLPLRKLFLDFGRHRVSHPAGYDCAYNQVQVYNKM